MSGSASSATVIAAVRQCPCGAVTVTSRGADMLGWYEREGRVADWSATDTCPECGWSLSDRELPIEEGAK